MAKKLLLLVLLACLLSVVAGCQGFSRSKSGVEVIVEGDGKFPEFLTGVWKADTRGWEFVFEQDGTISSAVITMGRVRMKPGEVTTIPMKKGGKGVFEPGQWLVHYTPASRELIVKISLKNFYAELGDDVLEGKGLDIFAGPVSEDGKLWHVDWTSYPDYVAHTERYPNFEISEDPNMGIVKVLTFEKVEEE